MIEPMHITSRSKNSNENTSVASAYSTKMEDTSSSRKKKFIIINNDSLPTTNNSNNSSSNHSNSPSNHNNNNSSSNEAIRLDCSSNRSVDSTRSNASTNNGSSCSSSLKNKLKTGKAKKNKKVTRKSLTGSGTNRVFDNDQVDGEETNTSTNNNDDDDDVTAILYALPSMTSTADSVNSKGIINSRVPMSNSGSGSSIMRSFANQSMTAAANLLGGVRAGAGTMGSIGSSTVQHSFIQTTKAKQSLNHYHHLLHTDKLHHSDKSTANTTTTNSDETRSLLLRRIRNSGGGGSCGYCFVQSNEAKKNVLEKVERCSAKDSLLRIYLTERGDILPVPQQASSERKTKNTTSTISSENIGTNKNVENNSSMESVGVTPEPQQLREQELMQMQDLIQMQLMESSSTFEQFVLHSIAQERKLQDDAKQSFQKTSKTATSFNCTEFINHDYTTILKLYDKQCNNSPGTSPTADTRVGNNTCKNEVDIVDIHLHAASHIMQQFLNIIDPLKEITATASASTTTPGSSNDTQNNPVKVVYTEMENYIILQLSLVTSAMKCITGFQAAKMICWYENFLQYIQFICPPSPSSQVSTTGTTSRIVAAAAAPYSIRPSPVWQSDILKLVDRYLEYGVQRDWNLFIQKDIKPKQPCQPLSPHKRQPPFFQNVVGTSLLTSEFELRRTRDGCLVTTVPEQIVYVMDLQMAIATEHLPERFVRHVLDLCYHEISMHICQTMMLIEEHTASTKTTTTFPNSVSGNKNTTTTTTSPMIATLSSSHDEIVARFCAIINDSNRLLSLLQERNRGAYATFYEANTSDNDNDKLKYILNNNSKHQQQTTRTSTTTTPLSSFTSSSLSQKMKNVERQLVELPLHAIEHLCRHIISRLEGKLTSTQSKEKDVDGSQHQLLLNCIGQPTWQQQHDPSGTIITNVIRMLVGYMETIQSWLMQDTSSTSSNAETIRINSDYLSKLVSKCFHKIVQCYLYHFYNNTMKYGISSSTSFVNQVKNVALLSSTTSPNSATVLAVMAKNLRNDYTILSKFFNSSHYFGQYVHGILSNQQINNRLLLIQSLSRLMDPNVAPTDLLDDIRTVLERTTTPPPLVPLLPSSLARNKPIVSTEDNTSHCSFHNVTAILHLAGLRLSCYSRHTGNSSNNGTVSSNSNSVPPSMFSSLEYQIRLDSMKWIRSIATVESAIVDSLRQQSPCITAFKATNEIATANTNNDILSINSDHSRTINTVHDDAFTVLLPDLSRSKYICNVVVRQDDVEVQFSDTRMMYAQATKDVIQQCYQIQQLQQQQTGRPFPLLSSSSSSSLLPRLRDGGGGSNSGIGESFDDSSNHNRKPSTLLSDYLLQNSEMLGSKFSNVVGTRLVDYKAKIAQALFTVPSPTETTTGSKTTKKSTTNTT